MRVLVACEFSGTVRNAFEQRGHSAWSCDLLPSEKSGLHHEGDVLDLLEGWVPVRWTMDCVIEDGSIDVCKSSQKYLCECPCYGPTQDGIEYKETSNGLFARPVDSPHWDLMIAHPPCTYLASSGLHWNKRRPERAAQTEEALAFVMALANAPIPKIAIENPIGALSSRWRKPDQIIQPWQFGEDASKATCLWLKGLPLLQPTDILPGGPKARRGNQTPSGQNKLGPSPDRWKERSRTFQGIADAMANQWG